MKACVQLDHLFAILALMNLAENTPYPELDKILEDYARKIHETVKDNFVGFYLQGSLALGDFDLTSDVDFIVITKEDLSNEQVKSVQRIHKETYNQENRWVKRFEYSYFPQFKFKILSSPYTDGVRNNTEERRLCVRRGRRRRDVLASPTSRSVEHDQPSLFGSNPIPERHLAVGEDRLRQNLVARVLPVSRRKQVHHAVVDGFALVEFREQRLPVGGGGALKRRKTFTFIDHSFVDDRGMQLRTDVQAVAVDPHVAGKEIKHAVGEHIFIGAHIHKIKVVAEVGGSCTVVPGCTVALGGDMMVGTIEQEQLRIHFSNPTYLRKIKGKQSVVRSADTYSALDLMTIVE
jgi:predicted nucleotidyltransferase